MGMGGCCFAIEQSNISTSGTDFIVAFPQTDGTPFVWRIGPTGYSEQTFPPSQTVAVIHSDSAITLVAGRRWADGTVSDLSSVLPTSSLADEYRVQGNWFTVVPTRATRIVYGTDTTDILAYEPFTFHSDTFDLSGMTVRSLYGDSIALFNGYDHLYEQALPTKYWSNQYAVTATKGKSVDIIGVQALADNTTIYINDSAVYTFDFERDGHYYWNFAYGDELETDNSGQFSFTECILSTSCPAIVHRFTVDSITVDGRDTIALQAMNRLTAIDRGTPQVGFIATGKGNEFVNVITPIDNVPFIRIYQAGQETGLLLPVLFNQLRGSENLSAARVLLPHSESPVFYQIASTAPVEHTVLATFYGVGASEYRYTGFEAIAPFLHRVYINDMLYDADMAATPICSDGTLDMTVTTNFPVQHYTWDFGDGTPIVKDNNHIQHRFAHGGVYPLTLVIDRDPMAICKGIEPADTIRLTVRVDYFHFTLDSVLFLCSEPGQPMHTALYVDNADGFSLDDAKFTVTFDDAAHQAGFREDQHLAIRPDHIWLTLPDPLPLQTPLGITISYQEECHADDTTLLFSLDLDPRHMLVQRYDYLLAIDTTLWHEGEIYNITWERDSVYLIGEKSSVLNRYNADRSGSYRVCFVQNGRRHCSCYTTIEESSVQPDFAETARLVATTAAAGQTIFVNVTEKSHADWYTIGGLLLEGNHTIPAQGGTIQVPTQPGIYILRISSNTTNRNYKIIVR